MHPLSANFATEHLTRLASTEYGWQATSKEAAFSIRDLEASRGKWVELRACVQIDGGKRSPVRVSQRTDADSIDESGQTFVLYPDAHGRVSFVWRLPQNVSSVSFQPVQFATAFSLKRLELRTVRPQTILWSSAISAAKRYPLRSLPRKARSLARIVRTGGLASAARALLGMHNEKAQTIFSEQASSMTAAERRRVASPDRLELLEAHVAEMVRKAQSSASDDYVPKRARPLDGDRVSIRAVAFYLPQFHPIPENDEWWGKGFTEWTNVTKACPQFEGHYQPHLPGELGFYDLRLPSVMHQQAELARHFGIAAFCFYYYWFGGRRLLEKPLENFVADPTIDMGFCYCWANENWSRRWDGLEDSILLAQNHSPEDDLALFDSMVESFRDPRYLRVRGAPVLVVYQIALLPDAAATARRWRERAAMRGLADGIYLVAARTFDMRDSLPEGFDATVEFPPHQTEMQDIAHRYSKINPHYRGRIYDYAELAHRFGKKQHASLTYKTVMPSWDNEARKPGNGHSFVNATPKTYAAWLRDACLVTTLNKGKDENLVFINAWNEWAEGAHLEPDRRWGYGYLDATAGVLDQYYRDLALEGLVDAHNKRFVKKRDSVVVFHLYFEDLLPEFIDRYLAPSESDCDLLVTTPRSTSAETIEKLITRFPNSYILISENRGRDIRPFLMALDKVIGLGYSFCCKIHSKKSLHRSDGDHWRRKLVKPLLGPDATRECLQALRSDPSLTMIVPAGEWLPMTDPAIYLGSKRHLDRLLALLDAPEEVDRYAFSFPAGSMYWLRVEAFLALRKIDLDAFEREEGQLDGTLAHAVERIMGALATKGGHQVMERAPS